MVQFYRVIISFFVFVLYLVVGTEDVLAINLSFDTNPNSYLELIIATFNYYDCKAVCGLLLLLVTSLQCNELCVFIYYSQP